MADEVLVLTTPPSAEPLSLAEARLHLKVNDLVTADDGKIVRLVKAARQLGERWTGRSWVTQTWTLHLPGFPAGGAAIDLRRPPVASVTEVRYQDASGATVVVSTSVYDVVLHHYRPQVVLKPDQEWPSDTQTGKAFPVQVVYVAGSGGAADVPEPYRNGVELLIGQWFEERSGTIVGTNAMELPLAVQELLDFERVIPV